ncbi:hypothetical protein JCM19992_00570 [Thermostilla marina]
MQSTGQTATHASQPVQASRSMNAVKRGRFLEGCGVAEALMRNVSSQEFHAQYGSNAGVPNLPRRAAYSTRIVPTPESVPTAPSTPQREARVRMTDRTRQ